MLNLLLLIRIGTPLAKLNMIMIINIIHSESFILIVWFLSSDNLGHTISIAESSEEPLYQPVNQSVNQPINQPQHEKRDHTTLTTGGPHEDPPGQSDCPPFNHHGGHSISPSHSQSDSSQYDPVTVIAASPREIRVRRRRRDDSSSSEVAAEPQSSGQSVNQAADPDWMATYIPDFEV